MQRPDIRNEEHELPLADRLVDEAIADWLHTHLALCRAGVGKATGEERAQQKILDEVEFLALAGYRYQLTPHILDCLRRAGLLADERKGG